MLSYRDDKAIATVDTQWCVDTLFVLCSLLKLVTVVLVVSS